MIICWVKKVDLGLILNFSQFYDPTLHYFMFQDFLLAPTLEEFAHIVHIPVRDQIPYILRRIWLMLIFVQREPTEVLLRSFFLRRPFCLLVVEVGMPFYVVFSLLI